jgi:cytochrome c-type biogenesis protein CcmE
MALVGLVLLGVGSAVALAVTAFSQNMLYFFSPSQIAAGEAPTGHLFRLGGLVAENSVQRLDDGVSVRFVITDNAERISVTYTGILPDLFREGQGIVALGRLDPGGHFTADEVLAKHDENYMPPEVADSLVNTAQNEGALPAAHAGGYTPGG